MAVQPTGTVTMLFTDIEGSTRLLERLGTERYRETLDLHRRLLREARGRLGATNQRRAEDKRDRS